MQRRFTFLSALAAAMMLAACASSPSRFYTLSAPPQTVAAPAPAGGAPLFIEVMPVSVPERLARPQIVVRSDAARLEILEQDRWSAPFNNELQDALRALLVQRLGALDVTNSGRAGDAPVYRIMVELQQLDAVRSGPVQAQFGLTVVRSDTRAKSDTQVRSTCSLRLQDSAGATVADVVQALQGMVVSTADALVLQVNALRNGKRDCH